MKEHDFTVPVPLETSHKLDSLACGEPSLDEWLKKRALKAEKKEIGCSEQRKWNPRSFLLCVLGVRHVHWLEIF